MNETSSPGVNQLALHDLARSLKGRRVWIVIIGVIAALLTGLMKYSLPPTFEATAKILVKRTSSRGTGGLNDQTVIDTDSFAAALESAEVLEKALQKLKLDRPPYNFDLPAFAGKVDMSILRREESIQVQARLPHQTENTQELVAEVANFFLTEADTIAEDLMRQDIDRSKKLLDGEVSESQVRLETIREKYKEAKLKSQVVEKTETLESLGEGLTALLKEYAIARSEFEQANGKLPVLESLLAGEESTTSLIRSIDEEPTLRNLRLEGGDSSARKLFSATVTLQATSEVYVNLRELRDETKAELEGYRKAVENLPTAIDEYSKRMQEAEKVLNESEADVEYWTLVLEGAQEAFAEVYKQRDVAVMAIATDRQDLISWIRAKPPIHPIGPGPISYGLIAGLVAMVVFTLLLVLFEMVRISFAAPGDRTS